MIWHLSILKDIFHCLVHSLIKSRSFCKRLASSLPLTTLITFASSAKKLSLLSIVHPRSLMYIRNRRGPSTDPCGTPLPTSVHSEKLPLIITLCFLSVNHPLIQPSKSPPTPIFLYNFLNLE